jgi:SAM-dependent methyltransferase
MAPLDQFHGGAQAATRELARQAGVQTGTRILDVGGGFGGPARMLAVEYGAQVTVLDLTAEYLRAGEVLTERMGLGGLVTFQYGNALDIPFPDGSFDLVWTQNSGMQIADKDQLYRGFFRVLRAGGRLAQLEPVLGGSQPPYLPLMWANEPADNQIVTAEALHAVICATGFIEHYWEPAVHFPDPASRPVVTIQRLVMGERLQAIQDARLRNEAEDRLRSALAVFERP